MHSPHVENSGEIIRPGVSQEFLRVQKIVRVSNERAQELLGFTCRHDCSGIWIPYHDPFAAGPVTVQGRAFGRVRLDNPRNGTKYLSPKNSGAQLYVPLDGGPFGNELVIAEGEFKTNSLCEAGIRAVGIGGISSAMKDGVLIRDLAKLIERFNPKQIKFLGDADTALNFEFSREAVKIARALPASCTLLLPRIPIGMPNGIDDCREQEGEGFMVFWEKIATAAIEVGPKPDPSHLSLRILEPEWETIIKDKDLYLPQLIALGGNLISETCLDELARRVKACWDVSISAFKSDATKQKHHHASGAELPFPAFYFDGKGYYRPRPNKDGFEQISREDSMLALRAAGYWHRTAMGCELTPCEVVLHRIQKERRVDYAGPICGRPPGLWQENEASILCTRGPTIICAKQGTADAMNQFLASLFGKDIDLFFKQQFTTFVGWIHHAREAIRNHQHHLPGQILGLIGPRDCGKSLCQTVITHLLGGREADASLWLVKGNDFNSDLWGAEHLRLSDEELAEDHRERHEIRDRLKKITTADVYPLHAKYRDAKSFRPIWRATLSANDDSDSISVLPMPTESFADKIIYLRCYKPKNPFHDGSPKASKAFGDKLVESIPAFLSMIEKNPIPDEYRNSRFFVREFHHPYVINLIASSSPVAPLGELLTWFLGARGGTITGTATTIFEELKEWNKENRGMSDYSKSASHFGHQLFRLSELPGWNRFISRSTQRVGGRDRNQEQTVWSITVN